ncbi:MAG: alkylhydroperoxidase-related (seleno)protein [Pseudomonadota bacterium]
MNRHFEYAENKIRGDLPEAYRQAWDLIARPGFWWRGAEKIAIAQESRNAWACVLCDERKAALSPNSVQGDHHSTEDLSAKIVDTVHRVTRDASRLSKSWLDSLYDQDFTDGHYIELVSVVVAVTSVDFFHHGMGLPLEPLPDPVPGEPSMRRPSKAQNRGAWVPVVEIEDLDPEDEGLYGNLPRSSNVLTALSLVPDGVRLLGILGAAQYLAPIEVANPSSNGGRALSRPQIEFVAGRVSAHNECFY